MKKSPLIPKSMGADEARKMLTILNKSNLPAKPELIAALKSRMSEKICAQSYTFYM